MSNFHDMAASNMRMTVVVPLTPGVLPEEMMVEVFLRLPIKSILRFRAVCRFGLRCFLQRNFAAEAVLMDSASSPPKLFFTSPTTSFDASSVFGTSSGPGDGLLFTLNDICGDFVSCLRPD
ncbi:hypothetical protein PR202_gb02049 [Eleusine coracana subsp. coracana]|uniref:F-box domain-containing protein n=1 Tax=Eleusine coracana subsp. coracana TaxID=191504 RepID=A0AAV5DY75_ELECO|nr:hypothetical protein PR202_gb02049 [Eleusine coracana subsp. coracana]